MIRSVAYSKAVLAGMAGAVAWEIVARLLIWAGVPFFDLVMTLGTLVLPNASPWEAWLTGMAVHLLVGAIWAVFYAYFFWSVLPLRPAFQGMVFAFVPMPLAIFIMHPQFDLMYPLVQSGQLSSSGLFGLGGGMHEPLSIATGHLIWGSVLGLLYTRPVGFRANRPPRLAGQPVRLRPLSNVSADPAGHRFMFATGIECSYPTLEGGRWRMDQMAACGHYRHWRTDLQLVRDLGLRYLRYGPPLHLIHHSLGHYDWAFLDEVATEMRQLGIVPIMDLCHFGLPDWLQNFQNPEVPQALADYAKAFARRYPWVHLYTPVNEMYVCAKLSALEGLWNEQCQDERAFVTAVRHLAKANILMMQAIASERPDAVFINSESGEFFQPCCPDPEIRLIAAFENERRFLPLDLLYARPVQDGMRTYLHQHGMPPEEYAWFMQQDVRGRSILGVDYYEWNEKLIDSSGHAQALGELFGWYAIARQYYQRYRRPMMHTETNRMDARDGPRWLWRQWHNVQLIRQTGVPVVGFTWYSLTDQVDWDIALREPIGNVNPVGLFDLNRDPRMVGLAYQHLVRLFGADLSEDPSIEAVLEEASKIPAQEERRLHA
ncbi:family 1 glycosylhydrolase [Microvirga guangxiensis]|uniref:Beta-glucosidase/6-phospho-beta-glucosidase/beta-galactosidase n=1 Tax=Microvirga guangxiensis TaxID=549386 RepID=A0A1G5L0K0_9HYPH|nr:family 1 glycosylhydrolase [Microvirga guangxiensis]SCZ05830.1 Beta-glucosidase/6-phospho-beta-glucosidase/beta-galactosidase [Microvirga guangxiensis]